MAIIKPFAAVRPQPQYAAEVCALPYDVMNSAEAREMAKGKPKSFLHVSRAEIDFPEGTDEHTQPVYDKARENFYKMINEGTLFKDAQHYLYIYEQAMVGQHQIGLVACSSVEDYFNDVIKKHEFTRPEKEEDRIRHMEAVQAHVGPIFLTYPQNFAVDKIIEGVMQTEEPVYNVTAADNVRHTIWVIKDDDKIAKLVSLFQQEIPYTYIADGHHRTASAAKVGRKMQEKNANHTGTEEYNFFLSVLFPDNQLQIMDYNRLVKDLNGMSAETLMEKLHGLFRISDFELNATTAKPAKPHQFAMYLGGKWYKMEAKEEIIKHDPIGILDISILQDNVLNPMLGIKDPRTDKRIDFVGGIRGLHELQRRVDSGEMAVAFALYPVSLKQLMDIADSGNVMPPKSTWFEPKLRDGFFSHLF